MTPKTINNLVYSQSAAARILGLSYEFIERIQYFETGIWVKVIGKKPTIISKKVFRQHFVDYRKSRSHNLIAISNTKLKRAWDVYNPHQDTWNRVLLHRDKITCTCCDYENQIRLLSKGCCKHAYKVLFELNFNSLSDYINYVQKDKIAV